MIFFFILEVESSFETVDLIDSYTAFGSNLNEI